MTIDQILRRAANQGSRNPPPPQQRFPAPRRTGWFLWIRTHPWTTLLILYALWLLVWGFHLWNVYEQRQLDATLSG